MNVIPTSLCINAGNPAALPQIEFDFLNNARVVNTIDVGAFENQTFLSNLEFQTTKIIDVYPNPTSGILNLSGNINYSSVFMINMLGQKYDIQPLASKLDLTNFSDGIYKLIFLKGDEILKSFSIIKN